MNSPLKGKPLKKRKKKTKGKTADEILSKLVENGEDCFTDILSSDSDNSSIEAIKSELLPLSLKDTFMSDGLAKEEKLTEEEETLERFAFYSMYLDDDYSAKEGPPPKPQYSDGYDNFQPYCGIVAYMKDCEAKQYILEDFDDEEFQNLLKAGLNEDLGLGDIDGNISLKTLTKANFEILGMDGPTRKIALIFNFPPDDSDFISSGFRDFMNEQKEAYTYIGGVLLLYEEIGIYVIEGSEYVILRHFPIFFESQIFKKLIDCKVLGIEELSAMKSFKQFACYKGTPPEPKETIKKRLCTYPDSIKFLKKLGKCLNIFFKFAYNDKPNVLEDNKIPENITANLPPKEYLVFALKGDWTPGLRLAEDWYYNVLVIATEADDSEFVWPPRSDHFPVHILHSTAEEDENLKKEAVSQMKSVKLPCHKAAAERTEEKVEPEKKDDFGQEEVAYDFEQLLDDEYEFPSESQFKPEKFPEGVKGYNSQSSLVDSEELNTDLEDFLEHVENVKM